MSQTKIQYFPYSNEKFPNQSKASPEPKHCRYQPKRCRYQNQTLSLPNQNDFVTNLKHCRYKTQTLSLPKSNTPCPAAKMNTIKSTMPIKNLAGTNLPNPPGYGFNLYIIYLKAIIRRIWQIWRQPNF